MGGLASAAFYGAGRAVEAVKSSVRSGCEGGSVTLKPDELVVRYSKFLDADGNIDWDMWAPNGGRVPGTIQEGQTLAVGTIIDRYGNPYGKYTSPVGVPYEQRALPYVENPNAHHKYEVIKPIDNVTVSQIAEAFQQFGGGMQYELPSIVNKLIKDKFLREVK
ncbi:MAG: TNT domain-containing protein [Lachnospiraceae bacterium]|nr:TNT domain-containing protein [Lachnospiraceae bacterium]